MNTSVLVVQPKNNASSSSSLSTRVQQHRKLSYGQLAFNSTTITTPTTASALLDGGGSDKNIKQKCALHQTNSNWERNRSNPPKKSHSTTDLSQLKYKSSSSSNRSGGNASFPNGSSVTAVGAVVFNSSTPPIVNDQQQPQFQQQRPPSTSALNSVTNETSASHLQQPLLKKTHQERRFRRLFRSVPTNEVLLSSKLPTKRLAAPIEISVESISSVNKTRTAKIIPNAVCVRTKHGKQYVFGSLLSRDNTHQLLVSVVTKPQTPSSAAVNFDKKNVFRPPGSDSMDVGISGSTASSPVDDNISVSSCSSGGESSDEASSTIHNGSSPNVDRLINNQKSSKLSRNLDDANRGILLPTSSFSSKLSLQALVTWFLSLPKIMMALIVCVALLSFLFMCATCLTIRLMYLHNPQSSLSDLISSTMHDTRKPFWTLDSFDRMNTVIDATLRLIDEVKHQLEMLKDEVFTETTSRHGSSNDGGGGGSESASIFAYSTATPERV